MPGRHHRNTHPGELSRLKLPLLKVPKRAILAFRTWLLELVGIRGMSVRRIAISASVALLLAAPVVAVTQPMDSFKILVDVNQITSDDATRASRFAADGVWAITQNSPTGINWGKTLGMLNAGTWTISEDDPTQTNEVDFISKSINRMVDGAMFYSEDGLATPLTDDQIAAYARHTVPGFGLVGSRIILLTRSYADGDPRQTELNHALASPNIAGATFEFLPDSMEPLWKLDVGCKYILSLNKKCYLLMPPKHDTADYISDIQHAITYLSQNSGILDNFNVYIVLATYAQPNTVHYLSKSVSDRNSIEAAVNWLKAYRLDPPFPPTGPIHLN